MNKPSIEKLIIVGSGPASLTAAIYASRAHLQPLIIEGPNPGGQLMKTSIVENWPGDITVMGPKLIERMKEHAQHYGTRFTSGNITKIEGTKSPFTLINDKGEKLFAHSVIIATGASAKKLHIPGEAEHMGKGVSICAVCDGFFYKDKSIVIVGGGDTAMETALFMQKFTSDITIVHILDKFTASAIMQERVINNPAIKIIYQTSVSAIHGDAQGVTGVTLTHQNSKEKRELPVQGVFIAIGYTPNSQMCQGLLDIDKWGYIKTTDQTKTSVEGIFAAGDVVDYHYRQAITASSSGCMAALDADRWLRAHNLV